MLEILRYLWSNDTPRAVAAREIAGGYRHSRGGIQYSGEVVSFDSLAWALGYAGHTSLYTSHDDIPEKAKPDLKKLYCVDANCWSYFRQGKYVEFVREYSRLHKGAIKCKPTDELPHGVLDGSAAVAVRHDWTQDKNVSTEFASLALRTGNMPANLPPGEVWLGFDLNCPEVKNDFVTTSLKFARMQFDCGEKSRTVALAARTGVEIDGATFDGVCFKVRSADPRCPSWDAATTGPRGIGLVKSVPGDFIKIEAIKPGSVVNCSVLAPAKDVNIESTFAVPGETPKERSQAKRQIILLLATMNFVSHDKPLTEFASCAITFVAKPADPAPDSKE